MPHALALCAVAVLVGLTAAPAKAELPPLIPRDVLFGKGGGMAAEIDGLLDMFFDGAGARKGGA